MGAVGGGVGKAGGGVTGGAIDGIVGIVGTGRGTFSSPVNLKKQAYFSRINLIRYNATLLILIRTISGA